MTIPELGFGSAPVMGRAGRKQSVAAIAQAYRSGIRHFDTARSYGWGEAEGLLGRTLAAYPRESYRLVSKCGFVPPRRSPLLSLAKSAARRVVQLVPGTRGLVRGVASKTFQPTGTYDVAALRSSLQRSLDELRTGYLDVLILHNYHVDKPGLPEVLAFLREAQQDGRVRRYGFSVGAELLRALEQLSRLDALRDAVVQVPVNDVLLQLPADYRDVSFIAHSPFRYLGEPGARVSSLSQLMNALGATCRCEALVCSMFTPEHIDHNVQARALAAARAVDAHVPC